MKCAMVINGLSTIMVLLTLMIVPGCSEKEKPQSKAAKVSTEAVEKEVKEAYEATKTYTQEQMQAFRDETETKLAEYEKDMDQLQAKAEKLGGDAKMKATQQLAALRQKRDEVSEKMKELSASSGDAWEQMKAGIDAAMADLVIAYKKAAAEFGKIED
jgi:hypothetical protein